MKSSNILKIAALALPLLLASCGTKKKVVDVTKPATSVNKDTVGLHKFVQRVNDHALGTRFLTSKLKFTVEVGAQNLTLTGNLRMKRDDVIRLQLMAFGFVEAGRLEFTKDYVLIMDRINKLYLKAPYSHIDFLRNSGLNFYSLQALFWNELFQPRRQELRPEDYDKFSANLGGDDVVISLEDGKLSYSWLSDLEGVIRMANILYKDKLNGNTQLNWDYNSFEKLDDRNKEFPTQMGITLTSTKKEVKLGMKFSYIGAETEWETRTSISNKYREVDIDEMLQRFMAL